jgi:hypothetical protein
LEAVFMVVPSDGAKVTRCDRGRSVEKKGFPGHIAVELTEEESRRILSTETVDNSVGGARRVLARPHQCWMSSDVLRDWAGVAQTFFPRNSFHETAFRATAGQPGSRA